MALCTWKLMTHSLYQRIPYYWFVELQTLRMKYFVVINKIPVEMSNLQIWNTLWLCGITFETSQNLLSLSVDFPSNFHHPIFHIIQLIYKGWRFNTVTEEVQLVTNAMCCVEYGLFKTLKIVMVAFEPGVIVSTNKFVLPPPLPLE